MYHVNEFTLTPRNNHLRVEASYIDDHLPMGQVVARQGNAVRVFDPERPELVIIVSRPWSEGDIFPLPLEQEDLEWAFNPEPLNIWSVFEGVPISGGMHRWWKHMRKSAHGRELLDAAARHIVEHDANPWAFSADWRHLEQVAEEADWYCYETMPVDALHALMGDEMLPLEEDAELEEGNVRL